jgi:hypothetical protein
LEIYLKQYKQAAETIQIYSSDSPKLLELGFDHSTGKIREPKGPLAEVFKWNEQFLRKYLTKSYPIFLKFLSFGNITKAI